MCVSPITIKNPSKFGPAFRQVPCGHCVECLKQYQNDWFCRIYEECCQHPKVLFFTLTYNQDSVPFVVDSSSGELFLSVVKKHLQNAFKRFRVRRDLPEFKYFICSEYGPRTSRPHYHGLIFGLGLDEFRPFLEDWQRKYGFTDCKVVKFGKDDHEKVARYVSKYCSKGVFENPNVAKGVVIKPFRLVSHHFGESYVGRMRSFHRGYQAFKGRMHTSNDYYGYDKDYIAYVASVRNVDINGIKYKMPNYYRSKIYGNYVHDSEGKLKLNPTTCLSVAVSNFVFEESLRVRDEKLQEICSSSGVDIHEAYRLLALYDDFENNTRDEIARASLTSFYNKSKF